MRHTRQSSQATSRFSIRIHWFRFQSRVAALYSQRVTQPWELWRAFGCPPECMPRIPWWQPFVYRWLVVTGWVRMPRRQRWPQR